MGSIFVCETGPFSSAKNTCQFPPLSQRGLSDYHNLCYYTWTITIIHIIPSTFVHSKTVLVYNTLKTQIPCNICNIHLIQIILFITNKLSLSTVHSIQPVYHRSITVTNKPCVWVKSSKWFYRLCSCQHQTSLHSLCCSKEEPYWPSISLTLLTFPFANPLFFFLFEGLRNFNPTQSSRTFSRIEEKRGNERKNERDLGCLREEWEGVSAWPGWMNFKNSHQSSPLSLQLSVLI